jgi:putative tricarboxylic transport membrane protein
LRVTKSDILGGFFWLILGTGFCLGSIKLKIGTLHSPGPGFISFLSGILLGLLGLALMLSSFLKGLKKGKNERAIEIWKNVNWRKLSWIFLALGGYILLFKPIGFVLSTFLFFFSVLYSFAKPRKWLLVLVISGCAAILGYFVFYTCLGVELPRGILK